MINYSIIENKIKKEIDEIIISKPSKMVSIILPTYNEKENIIRLITAITKEFTTERQNIDYEIVIVDDNSKDGTPKLIDDCACGDEHIIAVHRLNKKGIFSAIQDGIKLCNGKYFVIMDSDFSHPPAIISKLIENAGEFDMVSGSRFLKESGIEAPFMRKFCTIILNKFCSIMICRSYTDLTGGFHLINKEKFMEFEFKYPTIWGEFDMELFYLAIKHKLKIKEVPFVYKFREEGKSKSENLLKYGYIYVKRALQLSWLNEIVNYVDED